MKRTVCCSDCGTRVEVKTYIGLEHIYCDRCKKLRERALAEKLERVNCDNCKDRICEKGR